VRLSGLPMPRDSRACEASAPDVGSHRVFRDAVMDAEIHVISTVDFDVDGELALAPISAVANYRCCSSCPPA
jgi:hypothetical protein